VAWLSALAAKNYSVGRTAREGKTMAKSFVVEIESDGIDQHDIFRALRKALPPSVRVTVRRDAQDDDKPIRCPGCGELKIDEKYYCTNCGSDLPRR
jgi:hypothetical protein